LSDNPPDVSLSPGARVGPYEVVAPLGAGGMGEVFRARDVKLGRDVALKVLPAAFAADPDRLMRFEREARTLAALNHPHIAQVYGFEEVAAGAGVGPTRALVLELVDGDDLSARIARGPIPLDEALPIARQIADALEAAHEQGIIHRDLKPANIKVRADGTVKVLDFGLAKALEPHVTGDWSTAQAIADSPTITSPALTRAGIILGTAAYMAPEQAKGRPATKRSDIWAFGCVLYEMLTGRRAFEGEDTSDTLANVLKGEPHWSRVSSMPAAIGRLLRRCLTRDPRQRLADIADARLELDTAGDPVDVAAGGPRPPRRTAWIERGLWAVALVAAAALGALLARPGAGDQVAPELRLDIVTPPSDVAPDPSVAISPDGRYVAFNGDSERRSMLWVRAMDSGTARPIPGTENGRSPFWSSDSRALGFFTANQLRSVEIATGTVQTLAAAIGGGGGGAWSGTTILFSPNSGVGPLFRIDAAGGTPTPATTFSAATARVHRHPSFLPDRRHFLYAEVHTQGTQIFVGSLDGGTAVSLLDSDGGAVFSPSGHLLFARQGALVMQPFDPTRLAVTGEPQPFLDRVAINDNGRPAVAASTSGTLVYRPGLSAPRRQFSWYDRSGKQTAQVAAPEVSQSNPELSPDGSRLALQRNVNGNTDIWVLDLSRGFFDRVTTDPAIDALPVWSPDGRRVVFTSNRGAQRADVAPAPTGAGTGSLYVVPTDGSGDARLLVTSNDPKWATDWSRDGRQLLFRSLDRISGIHDVWTTPIEQPTPAPVLATAADERDAQWSPDERWIAYQSDESGRAEIYLQRFPGPGGKVRISTGGGTQVRWRADGRELFYVTPDNELAAVAVALPAGDGMPDVSAPTVLFATRMFAGGVGVTRQQYVVSRDGQRFLINERDPDIDELTRITVLLNWTGQPREEDRRR
jgi:Tol biopolymer transport system component